MSVDLSTTVGQLRLRSPLILGSGLLGAQADKLIEFSKVAGAVVTKSISLLPEQGSPPPRIARIDRDGMINSEGGMNPGIEAFSRTLQQIKSSMRSPLIGSLSPRTLRFDKGMEEVAVTFEENGAEAIELNFKYLYDEKELRTDFSTKQITEILTRLRRVVHIPLIAKLTYGGMDAAVLARAAEDAGAAAISAINSVFPAMKIDIKKRTPVLPVKFGGLSGPSIRPLAVAAVYRIASAVKIPTIGIGGIMSGEDVIEFLLAGACAVQIYTIALREGPKAFSRILGELESFMDENGIGSLREVIGAAHE